MVDIWGECLGGVCWCDGVLGFAGVLDNGNVSAVSVNGVGNGLEPAVGKSDVVLSVGVSSVTGLLVSEVVVAVVILHGVLPGVHGIGLVKNIVITGIKVGTLKNKCIR